MLKFYPSINILIEFLLDNLWNLIYLKVDIMAVVKNDLINQHFYR